MNFTFADVGSSYLNMVQQDLPREILSDSGRSDFGHSTFAQKLSASVERANGPINEAPVQAEAGQAPVQETPVQTGKIYVQKESGQQAPVQEVQDIDKIITSLSKKLDKESGINFISALKNIFLMLSKGDLKNISIDGDGLEALKKILIKAGFKEDDINDLIAELSKGGEEKSLSMDVLLDRLFDLPLEPELEPEEASENFLEMSALPFLESLLNSLGISREKIQEILSEADKGDKGISLDVVVEKLQAFQKTSFYAGNDYKTRANDDNFRFLLKQLNLEPVVSKESQLTPGLKGSESGKSVLTLDELVSSLEALRKKMSQQRDAINMGNNNEQKPVATDASIGLKGFDFGRANLTLDELVGSVGSMDVLHKRMSQHRDAINMGNNSEQKPVAPEASLDLFKDFFKGVKLEKKPSATPAFEFSSDQIKHQFKNGLLVSENGEVQAGMKHKAGPKDMDMAKEMVSVLDGKKNATLDMDDPSKESRGFLKELKSGTTKLSDQTLASASAGKTGETQTNIDLLKTKASFKNLPTYVNQQVSRSLVRAINNGENTLKIQLKPPELGRLVMTIDNTGSTMKVGIITDNAAARDILTSNVSELRTLLSNSGVNLEKFEVDMNSNFRQSMADSGNPTGNFDKKNRNRGNQLIDPVGDEGMNDLAGPLHALLDGALHFVA